MTGSDERAQMGSEILAELSPLLFESLAAAEWGRILVTIGRRDDGSLRVTDLEVQDIVGDDEAIDAAMAGGGRALLPVLANAVEALSAASDVDVDATLGGTFVRRVDDGFAFLPGLVRAPSDPFERLRDAAMSHAGERLSGIASKGAFSARQRFDLDVDAGTIVLYEGDAPQLSGEATLLGSFARDVRTWVWAWANPSVAPETQRRAQALCDACPHRAMWELTTPQFATDEATCWALAAITMDADEGAVLLRAPRDDGAIFVAVRSLSPVAPP